MDIKTTSSQGSNCTKLPQPSQIPYTDKPEGPQRLHTNCKRGASPEPCLLPGNCRTEIKQKPSNPTEDAKGQTGGQSNLHSKVAYNISLTLLE